MEHENDIILTGHAVKSAKSLITSLGYFEFVFVLETQVQAIKGLYLSDEPERHIIRALGELADFGLDGIAAGAPLEIQGTLRVMKRACSNGFRRVTEIIAHRIELLEEAESNDSDEEQPDDYDDDCYEPDWEAYMEDEMELRSELTQELYGDADSWERSSDEGWYYEDELC